MSAAKRMCLYAMISDQEYGYHSGERQSRSPGRTILARSHTVTPGRVLVVDDEPAIRALVARIVDRAGLPVDTAHHGADAIAKMKSVVYSVVVVDLMMPVVDGFGVVDYVRELPKAVRPAVIVISAGDSGTLRQLDGSVVHSILRKPFDIDVLGDLIAAAAKSTGEAASQSDGSVVQFPRSQR
jgi:DNA-binding response OmpR family regulator